MRVGRACPPARAGLDRDRVSPLRSAGDRRRANDEDRHGRVLDHRLGRAADDQALQQPVAAGADDDHVGAPGGGLAHDLDRGRALADDAIGVDARGPQAPDGLVCHAPTMRARSAASDAYASTDAAGSPKPSHQAAGTSITLTTRAVA